MKNPYSNPKNLSCWLFCTVIDNFGDIGVAWRLARELRDRLGAKVHLWLDDKNALVAIVPQPDADIFLHDWRENQFAQDINSAPKPDLVVELFACSLPETVRKIICETGAAWLNWEYLSAEDWALRTHTMQSLQADGCPKYFWQMGFVPQSGGLIREKNYLDKKNRFRQPEKLSGEWRIFAFGYASEIWQKWCACWENDEITLRAAGKPLHNSLPENFSGSLKIIRQDFVPQENFDELLWVSDINIIRGEDSFVRAQFAAKPFFWHIYPQDEMAHLDKLAAFWALYWRNPKYEKIAAAHTILSQELNGGANLSDKIRHENWRILLENFALWQEAANDWQAYLFSQTDTVSQLENWINQHFIYHLLPRNFA